MERGDSILKLQADIWRIMHGEDYGEPRKRTNDKSLHLQHAHQPISREQEKQGRKHKTIRLHELVHKAEIVTMKKIGSQNRVEVKKVKEGILINDEYSLYIYSNQFFDRLLRVSV